MVLQKNKIKYKIVDNVIYTEEFDGSPDPKGIGHFYYVQMQFYKDKTAQIDGHTKEEYTFGSLLQSSIRLALSLIDEGIKPGDNVSLCTNIHPDCSLPHIACYFIGAVMAAIEPSMSVSEAFYLLKQTLPKIIFVAPQFLSLVENTVELLNINTKIVVFGESSQYVPFQRYIQPHKDEGVFKPRAVENLQEVALIVFSSGTTGRPKGVCYSHYNMLWFFAKNCASKVDDTTIWYSIANPYWSVFPIFLHISISYGFTRVQYPYFDINNPWTLFFQHVDVAFLNPLNTLQMVRCKKPSNVDLRNVKILHIGGNSVSLQQINEIRSALPHTIILQGYSQSEIFQSPLNFIVDGLTEEIINKKQCSVGSIIQGVSYKVVDIETKTVVGPNQIGELLIKSPAQSIGYYNLDSSECFDSEGWLKTGDLFYYDEDLYFYFVDRIKESFKVYNWHISPIEIENIILELESIEMAIVIGIPHEIEYNQPVAIVKLKKNVRPLSAEEIIKYVNDRVENKKKLRGGVKFVSEIPLSFNGKVSRMKLKKMVLNNEI